ncbi:MAG TPA: hypothetical protein VMS89_05980 [Methanoregulaceae archaeon]|nr:hypothetical protein [Methanoregulaceae archaeon]
MNRKTVCAIFFGMAFVILFITAMAPASMVWPPVPPQAIPIGAVMWKSRTLEAILQGFILLAGVFSILLLLGPGTVRRRHP